jgi:XTP/dITP diphosphohydrolase
VLVYLAHPGVVPVTVEGTCAGRILEAPRGAGGFGYDPYFLSDDLGKTFGEATPEEKDGVSHRGRALRALVEKLGPPA